MLYYPSYLLELLSSDRVAILLISLCWLLTCFRLYHALSAIFISFCSICPLQITKRLIKKNRFVCLHVECVYGSWFDRELEWEEAAKKHPKNFYVLYYEDLKQVILNLSVSIIRPNPDCNLSGLSGRAWIFPSFAGKSRHGLKTTGILSRCQFMTVFANVL